MATSARDSLFSFELFSFEPDTNKATERMERFQELYSNYTFQPHCCEVRIIPPTRPLTHTEFESLFETLCFPYKVRIAWLIEVAELWVETGATAYWDGFRPTKKDTECGFRFLKERCDEAQEMYDSMLRNAATGDYNRAIMDWRTAQEWEGGNRCDPPPFEEALDEIVTASSVVQLSSGPLAYVMSRANREQCSALMRSVAKLKTPAVTARVAVTDRDRANAERILGKAVTPGV